MPEVKSVRSEGSVRIQTKCLEAFGLTERLTNA